MNQYATYYPNHQIDDRSLDGPTIAFMCVLGIIAIVIYLMPSIVARSKKHRNIAGILFLNIFLGWTGVMWVICFVWALIKENESDRSQVVVHNQFANVPQPSVPQPISDLRQASAPVISERNLRDQLIDLKNLKSEGLITEEEYERKKNNLLY